MMLPLLRVTLGRLLGEGGFAFVYTCSDVYDCAVKYCLKKIIIQVGRPATGSAMLRAQSVAHPRHQSSPAAHPGGEGGREGGLG